jgi:hypothetical protein
MSVAGAGWKVRLGYVMNNSNTLLCTSSNCDAILLIITCLVLNGYSGLFMFTYYYILYIIVLLIEIP